MKKRLINILLIAAIAIVSITTASAKSPYAKKSNFPSYKGLVMAGYQGWFNAEGDGGERGWNHYRNGKLFEPGACTIDAWPDMREYKKSYKTAFKHADGSPAYVFSSYDKSTVDLHFEWMCEYGVDGVFMQRFVQTIKSRVGLSHSNVVLRNAINAAEENDRVIAIMYDLSGMVAEDVDKVIEDWKSLADNMKIASRKENNYLYHNGKPLVAIWGVGFGGGRKYSYPEIHKLIDFFQNDPKYGGCSLLLGVPTYWRELGRDTDGNQELHAVIKRADIVHPWFVGRFNDKSYKNFSKNIVADIEWCKQNNLDYVPVVFPGFSWKNMHPDTELDANPRNEGRFYWNQIAGSIKAGAQMLYFAMFDEIDEGTAIFKITNTPPMGDFLDNDGMPSDWHLRLSGIAGKMLRGEIEFSEEFPLTK
ncbi:MAG: glycoside hydrolase family 71/99-like protein [Rikenellaceae bacterium]